MNTGCTFEERLGLLVDRELTARHSRQLSNRLRRAKLRHSACIEDIDFRQPRGLDKALVLSLADGRWVREHLNVLITGPAGIGTPVAPTFFRTGVAGSWRTAFTPVQVRAVADAHGEGMERLGNLKEA